MFCFFVSLGVLFISAAINEMSSVDVMSNLLSEEAQINSGVLPPGSYQLLFWDKFVNRFYGNLETAELFAIDANGNLKFKKGAFRMNDKKAISERFFQNRLQYVCTEENGEFTFNRSNVNENRPVHVYLLPLDSDGGLLMSERGRGSDIAEQTDRTFSSDCLALPTVIRYHSLDQRNKIVLEMFERWLFGKSKLLSQSDCFFVEAYIQQMYKHLNGMIMNRREQHTTDQSEVIEEDFKLYSELGSMLSRALHSRQLADRVLMVGDIVGDIRMLCASIATLRAVQQHKSFDELGHWAKLCQNLDNLWDVAMSRAIDRWLTEAKGADQQLQMGDDNALSAVAEELSLQMQTIAQILEDGPAVHNQPEPFSLEDQLNQVPMLGTLGRKLETARQTNAKWTERVTAVSGMLEHLGILCKAKSAIARECSAQSRWTREIEEWHSFCAHLKFARNFWVLRAVGRWLYGSKELRSDEQYLLEMQLENLIEKMEPASPDGAMSLPDFALLSRIGMELVKARKSKRLAARAMTVPGLWDQLTNICTVIEGFMARSRRPLATCWAEFCGKLEELDVIVVMNALERWRDGTPCESDPRVIIEASKKALRAVRRVAAADRRGTPPMSGVESALLAELGAYFADEFEMKKAAAAPDGNGTTKVPPIISMEGMDKMLREQCNRWTAFRRNIPPESRKMFVSWSKICKAIDLKEINNSEKEKMRDKIDEQMAEGQREVKDKRKEEEMAN